MTGQFSIKTCFLRESHIFYRGTIIPRRVSCTRLIKRGGGTGPVKPRQPNTLVPIPAEGILKDEREIALKYLSLLRGIFNNRIMQP